MINEHLQFSELPAQCGHIGLITLNRPQALNALNHAMILNLHQKLLEWRQAEHIKAVIIKAVPGRAFCAGGDVREVYTTALSDPQQACQFFWHEYHLNYFIHHYPKPYIALLDGITMGGGVGISLHSPLSIATENFVFAMPETAIGFFPDIGSSYLLNRCPKHSGTYLALTGARLRAADCQALGLLNYQILQKDLESLTTEICHLPTVTTETLTRLLHQQHPPPTVEIQQHLTAIQQCFSAESMEAIQTHLQQQNSPWATECLNQLSPLSPTSLKVTLALLQYTRDASLADCLQLDYRIACRMLQAHDFYEGVRTRLVDKTNHPIWQPTEMTQIADVTDYFASLQENELTLSN